MPKIYKGGNRSANRSKVAARTIAAAVTHAPANDPTTDPAETVVDSAEVLDVSEIAPDPSTDFTGAFNAGEAVKFAGREWKLRFLDVNDMIELEQRLPAKRIVGEDGKPKIVKGFEALDLETIGGIRLFFYLVLRKSDPDLSEKDLDDGNYKLTENAVGRMMSVENLQSPDTLKFINTILIRSGLAPDPAEKTRPNAGAGRKAASR